MTDVSLQEHLESRMDEMEKRHLAEMAGLKELMEARFFAQETAVKKSEDAYNSRFALANEFRTAMSDLSATFATRTTVDEKTQRINEIEKRLARIDGQFATWAVALAVLSFVISVIARFIDLGGA